MIQRRARWVLASAAARWRSEIDTPRSVAQAPPLAGSDRVVGPVPSGYTQVVWAWIATTAAAPVVLYDLDADEAVSRVRLHTGREVAETRSVHELAVHGEPVFVGARPVGSCVGDARASLVEVGELLAHAEHHRRSGEPEAWSDGLARASAAWLCLGEPASAPLGARLHLLIALRHLLADDAEGAHTALRRALAFDPGLDVPEGFSPPLQDALVAARDAVDDVRVRLHWVLGRGEPLWVDAVRIPRDEGEVWLAPGVHLVQVGTWTRQVEFEQEEVWLGDPAVEVRLGPALRDENGREQLGGMVRAAGLEAVYVPRYGHTWVLEHDRWNRVTPPIERQMASPLLVSGVALTVLGVGWMAAESAAAQRRIDAVNTTFDSSDYSRAGWDHRAGHARWIGSLAATTVGVGLGTTGLVLRSSFR